MLIAGLGSLGLFSILYWIFNRDNKNILGTWGSLGKGVHVDVR